jgi:thiosulfate reductase cytochrome b subunit
MYLYPKWIRLWHLLNAVIIILLILTGISIKFAGAGNGMKFIIEYGKAVKWHNSAAIMLTVTYIFFVTGNFLTENGKYYKLKRQNLWSGMGKQARYYVGGIFRGEKDPFPVSLEQKFNPLQKFSYIIAMYVVMPLVIISGMDLLFPAVEVKSLFGVSVPVIIDILHITMAILLALFLVIHIYISTLGLRSVSRFRGIITGFVESEDS